MRIDIKYMLLLFNLKSIMAIDIKLAQDTNNNFVIDFEDGDFKQTEGLDTAIYMSIFGQKRANRQQVIKPELRRGHFSNDFNDIEGYEVGSAAWLNIDQAANSSSNLTELNSAIIQGLQWTIADKISKNNIINSDLTNSGVNVEVEIEGESEEESNYYNTFIKTSE